MKKNRKQKLIELEHEALADALLQLAERFSAADDLVEQLIATPQESIQRFRKKLFGLKHSSRFVDWRESSGFADELEMLLQDVKLGARTSLSGLQLLAEFYMIDSAIFEMADDSSGSIGEVFTNTARALFVEYASLCKDKEKVAEIILKLNRKDSYGVRGTLVDCAGECLPKLVIRKMISKLQKLADDETEAYEKRHYLMQIESLARQLKDAKLFEQTRIAAWGELSTKSIIDIARVYFESKDIQTAYTWIKKIPENETLHAYEREQLLLDIFRRLGNRKKLTELLYRKFHFLHSTETLLELLDVIGHDKRDEVISKEIAFIITNRDLCLADAKFLISVGRIEMAEEYLLKRAEQLNGFNYGSLLTLAEAMESDQRNLVASLIYRSLLISILERGYSKAYFYGVRYLNKLDHLAAQISDWNAFADHKAFKALLKEQHGRKHSFWSKYTGKN